MAEKKTSKPKVILYRSEKNKMLAGVCGGLGEIFDIDPTLIRLVFLLAVIFGGSGLLIYIIMWLIIPAESQIHSSSDQTIKSNVDEMKSTVKNFTESLPKNQKNEQQVPFPAIILIIVGIIFLLGNFGLGEIFNIGRLWPLILIALGFVILTRRNE